MLIEGVKFGSTNRVYFWAMWLSLCPSYIILGHPKEYWPPAVYRNHWECD